jgi:hypothetical protein
MLTFECKKKVAFTHTAGIVLNAFDRQQGELRRQIRLERNSSKHLTDGHSKSAFSDQLSAISQTGLADR